MAKQWRLKQLDPHGDYPLYSPVHIRARERRLLRWDWIKEITISHFTHERAKSRRLAWKSDRTRACLHCCQPFGGIYLTLRLSTTIWAANIHFHCWPEFSQELYLKWVTEALSNAR